MEKEGSWVSRISRFIGSNALEEQFYSYSQNILLPLPKIWEMFWLCRRFEISYKNIYRLEMGNLS